MTEDIQGRRFPGFGCCIYCGSEGGDGGLRDEHIIPFSLGGNAVIQAASCSDCEAKTSYPDGYLARAVFQEFRTHAGVQTRNPRDRPTAFQSTLIIGDSEERRTIPLEDHPHSLGMPNLSPCGLIRGAQPSAAFEATKIHLFHNVREDIRARLNIRNDADFAVRFRKEINLVPFGRALAKIAYCHAIANLGIDAFRPLNLPALILGSYPCVSYYVGGDGNDDTEPPDPSGRRHWVNIEQVDRGRQRLLLASIRLFADSGTEERGMPIYRVVTGVFR